MNIEKISRKLVDFTRINKCFADSGEISPEYKTDIEEYINAVETLKEGDIITTYVKDITLAGYKMILHHDTSKISGFMPNTLSGVNKLNIQEKIDLLGQTIEVVIESIPKVGAIVVSRKKYLESLIPEKIKELKTGILYKGMVTGTNDTCIFVQFMDFLTGMIHVSNVYPAWQNRLSEIPSGFEIEFYVENITSSNKINLRQILRETLWDTIKIGQIVNAKVISIKSQGILCKLGDNNNDNTMGMIHTSEVEKNNKTYNIGNTLMVKILKIDRINKKIYLGIV